MLMVSEAGLSRDAGFGGLGLMRQLFASLPAAVAYVAGPELVFQFANEEYRQLFGGRDLIGLPLCEALPELAGQGRFEILDRVVETGEPFQGRESELWIRRQGGEPERTFLDFVYQPILDDAGSVAGVLLFGTDVTAHVRDRRRLEMVAGQLALTEERYRTLFETLPLGVIHYRKDRSIIEANPAAGEILGLVRDAMGTWPVDRTRRAVVHEDGSPYEVDELPVMVALRTGAVVPDEVVGVPHGGTGELRWLRVTAVPDARDEQGRPQRVYAILADITEQHRAESTLREGTKLLGRLRDANILGMVAANEQGAYDANDAFLDIVGYSRRDIEAGRLSSKTLTAPEYASLDQAGIGQLRATGVCQPYDKEYIHRDGHRVPVLVGAAVTGWNPLRWVVFVVDLTARQRSEQERAELLARERAARVEADAAQERLALLLGAGDLVAATRHPDDLLEQVTQLVVPALADWCVALMPTPDGKLRATRSAHRDPAGAELLKRLRDHPIAAAGPLMSQIAYTTATTQLASDFSAQAVSGASTAPELMKIVGQVRPASALAVPLQAGQRPLGVLVLGRGEPCPRFAETDVAVVEELARRLAAGLATVETFAREHTVAETLQHALLPDAPPAIEGLDLAARYLPASDGVHVGGDWYDAFPLDHHRVGLAIGDVAGHSIGSASIMGQVRSLLHGYAIDNPSPPQVLQRTNTALCQMLPDALATAWHAVLDPATGDLDYASAGHPPPLISSGCGHAEYLAVAPATILGASPDTAFTATHRRLPPGTRLLLYTDGLVEDRHRDIDEGLTALAAALQRSSGQSAEEICQAAQTSLLGSAPRADDVCILAVGLTPGPASQPNS